MHILKKLTKKKTEQHIIMATLVISFVGTIYYYNKN